MNSPQDNTSVSPGTVPLVIDLSESTDHVSTSMLLRILFVMGSGIAAFHLTATYLAAANRRIRALASVSALLVPIATMGIVTIVGRRNRKRRAIREVSNIPDPLERVRKLLRLEDGWHIRPLTARLSAQILKQNEVAQDRAAVVIDNVEWNTDRGEYHFEPAVLSPNDRNPYWMHIVYFSLPLAALVSILMWQRHR